MKNKGKYNIALVGCGRISKNHFDAIRNNSKYLNLVSVCDIEEDRAKEAGNREAVEYFTSYKEMLKSKKDIDIVSICTPSGLHPQHGILAAQNGIHVICEKPMAVDEKKAQELIDICSQNKVKLYIVLQNRLNETVQLLKRAIEENRFGKIYQSVINVFWQRPQSYYDQASWRGTKELDGGAFLNQASHYVDLISWLFGPVDSLNAMVDTFGRDIDVEDAGSVIIRFKRGVIVSVNVNMLTYPKNLEGSITVIGEKGTIRIGGTALNKIEHWEFTDNWGIDIINTANYEPPNVYGFGHTSYYNNVLNDILGKKTMVADGVEGKKSLDIILDIYKCGNKESKTKELIFA